MLRSDCLAWAVAAALAAASPSYSRQPQPAAGPSFVRVAVRDSRGEAIAGAQFTLLTRSPVIDLSKPAAQVVTADDAGYAELPPADLRHVWVVAEPGYETIAVTPVTDGTVVLRAGRALTVKVHGPDGPMAARLSWSPSSGPPLSIRTDERGAAEARGLPRGAIDLRISAGSLALERRVGPDDKLLIVTLAPKTIVRGTIVDMDGSPLPGAEVTFERPLSSNTSYTFRQATSDEQGRFRLDVGVGGVYEGEIRRDGYQSQHLKLTVETGQTLDLARTTLAPGWSIEMQFQSATTGLPVASPVVVRESDDPRGFSLRELWHPRRKYVGDNKGRVVVTDAGAEVVRLALDTPGYARLALPPVDFTGGATVADLGVILVDAGAVLDITVEDRGGRPRPEVPVRLDRGPALSPLAPATASTAESGHARLDRLGPGRYRLRVGDDRAGGWGMQAERWFTVGPRDTQIQQRIVLGGVSVALAVVHPGTLMAGRAVSILAGAEPAQPVTRATMPVRLAGGSGPARLLNAPVGRGAHGVLGADGRAVLADVPIGPAHMSVQLATATWSRPLIVPGEDFETTVLVPAATSQVEVRSQAGGAVIPDATVSWSARSGERVEGTTRNDGTVLLDGLVEGPGALEVRAEEYRPVRVNLASWRDIPLHVMLTPDVPTSFTCVVESAEGTPLADATVEMVPADSSVGRQITLSDADGIALIDDAPVGQATLAVRRRGFGSVILRNISLRPGPNDMGVVVVPHGFRVAITDETDRFADNEVVRLRVTDTRGGPVDLLLDENSALQIVAGGTAEIGPLPPGEYWLDAIGRSYSARERFTITDSNVAVTLK